MRQLTRTHRAGQAWPGDLPAEAAPALWPLLDDLQDGVALADSDGQIALASRRLEEMFGYQHGDLAGRTVEFLIPGELRAAHRRHRAAYTEAPGTRPMGAGARLTGLRQNGTTFPVEISLSPVTIAGHCFILATVREIAQALRLEDLARPAAAAPSANGTVTHR